MKKIISLLKNKNSFLFHVSTMVTGTVLAQAITILCSPVITRLYEPADIGIMASLIAIVTILSNFSTGRYESASVLPDKEEDATTVAYLALFISIFFSITTTLFFIFLGKNIAPLLGLKDAPVFWLYFIGPLTLIFAFQNVLTRICIRDKRFKVLASSQVMQNITNNSFKIGFGFTSFNNLGLFLGSLLGPLARGASLLWGQRKRFFFNTNFPPMSEFKRLAKRYKDFPLIGSWSVLINTFSLKLPLILFASLFSSEVAGFFSLSYSIISLPMTIIGRSVGDVFVDRAAKARKNPDELKRIVFTIIKRLLLIGALSMSVVTFYGDLLFPFIFGTKWEISGKYAQWISIWQCFALAFSPTSRLFGILEKQGEFFIISIILFIARITSIYMGRYLFNSDIDTVMLYGIVGAILYCLLSLRILVLSKVKLSEGIISTIKIVVPVFLIQFIISYIIRGLLLN